MQDYWSYIRCISEPVRCEWSEICLISCSNIFAFCMYFRVSKVYFKQSSEFNKECICERLVLLKFMFCMDGIEKGGDSSTQVKFWNIRQSFKYEVTVQVFFLLPVMATFILSLLRMKKNQCLSLLVVYQFVYMYKVWPTYEVHVMHENVQYHVHKEGKYP